MSQIIELTTIVQSIFTVLTLLVGGWWTYRRFVLQREDCPKLEFDIDLKFVGIQNERHLIEVAMVVSNKGLVRHRLSDFRFNVRYLLPNDALSSGGPPINHQIKFNHSINNDEKLDVRWVVPWQPFIDPSVTQPFVQITSIPTNATFVLVWSEFRYRNIRDTKRHIAQRVFKVPAMTLEHPKSSP